MTIVDVVFRYGTPPGEREIVALRRVWEVYGIRKVSFTEAESKVRVEYDATRMNDATVGSLLRRAGLDITGMDDMAPAKSAEEPAKMQPA